MTERISLRVFPRYPEFTPRTFRSVLSRKSLAMRVSLVRPSGCLALAVLFLILCPVSIFAAPPSDEAAAERVLGPQWKQLSRRAGIIFAGTLVSSGAALTTQPGAPSGLGLAGDVLEFRFRVDRPIAGVEPSQLLTIREWTGVLSRQCPMHQGDRILLFLYPPSRLGLTSPVGGLQGQIRLDPSSQHVAGEQDPLQSGLPSLISVTQLERAIRAARGD